MIIIGYLSNKYTEINRDNIVRNITGDKYAECIKALQPQIEKERQYQIENDPDLKAEQGIITRVLVIAIVLQIACLYIFSYLIVHILNNEQSNKALK